MSSATPRTSPSVPSVPGDADVPRRLLIAASEVFAERGYESATVREIVARAGTNLNAINYHFRSKKELYAATWRYQLELAEARHPIRPDESRSAEPREALREAVEDLIAWLLDPSSLVPQLYAIEMVNPSPMFVSMQAGTGHQRALENAVRAVAGKGMSTKLIARCVRSVYSQCAYYMLVRRVLPLMDPDFEFSPRTVRTIAEQITEFSVGGIEAVTGRREEHGRRR